MGLGVHWYTGDHFDALAAVHANFSDKAIFASEAMAARDTKAAPTGGTWANGEHYAHDMIGAFNTWVTGFLDWNLALDANGGPEHVNVVVSDLVGSDAMFICDTKCKKSCKCEAQAFYWYVGHFSKYVPQGSRRIGWALEGDAANVEATAFLTPSDEVVAVVMNTGDAAQSIKLSDCGATAAVDLPAHSIQTLRYPRASAC